ncbi:SDR family oxidoreductase [Corynebacterium pygosceleis]|uniref:SDR family oxidoreductase n=1 Tax=Corynebacterium pygosceleis TaxID=2800406 RepID=UPI0019074E94|nr:SDR family oxidoreductase [Corynebacterium pygosceleis]MCL0119976.1 SDR family oxidoreductase [Corynebacterium pygosceleis]
MGNIFISGGAQGIGAAVAGRFLREGWTVGVYDISVDGPDISEEQGGTMISGRLDVTDPDSWNAALAEFTAHTGGRLDVLDNNAGIIADGNLAGMEPGHIAAQINVNCLGVTLGARAAHPYLAATPGSHLVNMASASAIYGQPDISVYSATKFYVAGLTEALNLEWHDDGIRVVDLWPLWAKTSLADVDAGSVRRLGVNITPESVADVLWDAVHPTNRLTRAKVHYDVSTTDRIMHTARELTPHWMGKIVTRLVAG